MKPFVYLAVAIVVGACSEPPPPLKMASVSVTNQHAECPRDSTVVGGGYEIAADHRAPGKTPIVVASRPTETGWMVQCVEPDGQPSRACKSYVLCATVLH